ncbi:MAG: bifunctional oligoribonuclease/PAP phosphatase NrnA [Capnocytophaga sp.]|nr:bifunctional oligoribonuclease/PAP phosphatase NrnA [Capnocytophaga sp.]
MKIQDIETIKRMLAKHPKISIIPHKNPDGDAMGSCLGLYHYLQLQGYDATVVAPNDYPENLKWLPASEKVMIYELDPETATRQIEKSQLIFTLDFNSLDRADVLTPLLEHSKADFVMIDHHQQPKDYARVTFSNTKASSTCAMVYGFIDTMGNTNLINKDIATCLYTGIMTDTGNFKHATTTSNTLRIAATLIDKGADNALINNLVYDTNSYDRLQLLSLALKNMVYLPEYATTYTVLTSDDLKSHNFQQGDTEGIVNYGLSIKNTRLAVIFIEYKDKNFVKMSFRSKGNLDVNILAREQFNGGGHSNAAGGRYDESLEKAVAHFLTILPEYTSAKPLL